VFESLAYWARAYDRTSWASPQQSCIAVSDDEDAAEEWSTISEITASRELARSLPFSRENGVLSMDRCFEES
jgi:hypothetical protein